jgi:hypothetical protein
MTTTDQPRGRGASGGRTQDLRLYLITLLATVYVGAWWSFASRPTRSAAAHQALPYVEPGATRVTWYEDLPVSKRPLVALPRGWHIAPRAEPSRHEDARRGASTRLRVVSVRPGRIRTRSS